jgi:hypothetical protein
VDGAETDGPTDMVAFEKLTLWPLVIGMFVIGIYPTVVLHYFNGSSLELLAFIQSLL